MNTFDNVWSYDIESFPNLFSVTFWNKEREEKVVFQIFGQINDSTKIAEWVLNSKNLTLVGYNSLSYDNPMLNSIIKSYKTLQMLSVVDITQRLNTLSKSIIHYDECTKDRQKVIRNLREISNSYYQSIDLLEVIREGYATKSLKGVAINLKWHRIQDLPYPFDQTLTQEEGDIVIDYNFNDVLITQRAYEHLADRLEMRRILSEQYQINLISKSDSAIAKELFTKFYAEGSGMEYEEFKYQKTRRTELYLHEIILPWISFQTLELQDYLEKVKNVRVWNIEGKTLQYEGKIIKEAQFDIPSLEYNNMIYTIGLGGIHSVDKPGIFEANEEMMLLDVDVASQYPIRILDSKIVPKHLDPKIFLPLFKGIIDTRLAKKAEGKKDKIARIIAEGLKIVVNTVYGLYNFAYYFLYDPLATYKVTINNQLAILMLIEELNLNGINIISANTDGIICYTKSSNLLLIREIYKVWEQTTGFTLEETNYSKYIRRDINNYITVKTNGEIKAKGIFVPQLGILKGYDKPIVAIALQEYFINGKQPKEVIETLGYSYTFVNPETPKGEQRITDIYDYCMAQKIGETYDNAVIIKDGVEYPTQRSVRYYAANEGVGIYKKKWIEDKKVINKKDETSIVEAHWSYQTLLASSPVVVFNDYVDLPDYNINLEYYIEETEKIIAAIEGREWVDLVKLEAKIDKLTEAYHKIVTTVQNLIDKNKTHLKSFPKQLLRGKQLSEELNNLIKLRDGKQ